MRKWPRIPASIRCIRQGGIARSIRSCSSGAARRQPPDASRQPRHCVTASLCHCVTALANNDEETVMTFRAPVVDGLSVRVVVDSRYERFLPKASHSQVRIEHIGRIPGRPDTTFAAEWGLSLHLASAKDGAKAEYVLDFGY